MARKIIPIIIACVLIPFTDTQAKDVAQWQKIHWPPFQILRGDNAGKGRSDIIIKLIQSRLPQYEHQDVEMNWTRYWKEIKSGKHILNSLAIKTEERAQYTVFSKTISFALPHRIIMKKSTISKLDFPESVDLQIFIKDQRISGIIEKTRSYGVVLDRLLNANENGSNFTRDALEIEHLMRMILADRIDYTIEYSYVADFILKKYDMPEDMLGTIRIEDLPRYIRGHVAAPKNSWGIKIINEINPILDELSKTQQYLELHKKWHSDSRELKEIERIYTELFLE